MHRQYRTYIKQDAIITVRLYLATCYGRDRPSSGQLRTRIKVQPLSTLFYYTLIVVLSWPEDGRSRPKHVVKYNVIVINVSCSMYVVYWRCIIYYKNLIRHNGMASLSLKKNHHDTWWTEHKTHVTWNWPLWVLAMSEWGLLFQWGIKSRRMTLPNRRKVTFSLRPNILSYSSFERK